MTDAARAVDGAGLDALWVGDHLVQANPYDTTGDDMLEAYTVLGVPGGPGPDGSVLV